MEEGRIVLQKIEGAEGGAEPVQLKQTDESSSVPQAAEGMPGQSAAEPEECLPGQQPDGNPAESGKPAPLTAAMESILFAMGDSVPVASLASALEVGEEEILEAALSLEKRYASSESGLVLNRYGDSLQLSTKPELYDVLIRIASEPKKPKLTPTLMETLSIIAFRQPVTRMEVEQIRGVNSDFAINRLVSFDLVQEVGRREVPGRPLLFGTTEQFLRSFGIRSVDELPEPDLSLMEVFKEEAEEEVTSKLDV